MDSPILGFKIWFRPMVRMDLLTRELAHEAAAHYEKQLRGVQKAFIEAGDFIRNTKLNLPGDPVILGGKPGPEGMNLLPSLHIQSGLFRESVYVRDGENDIRQFVSFIKAATLFSRRLTYPPRKQFFWITIQNRSKYDPIQHETKRTWDYAWKHELGIGNRFRPIVGAVVELMLRAQLANIEGSIGGQGNATVAAQGGATGMFSAGTRGRISSTHVREQAIRGRFAAKWEKGLTTGQVVRTQAEQANYRAGLH